MTLKDPNYQSRAGMCAPRRAGRRLTQKEKPDAEKPDAWVGLKEGLR